MKLNSYIPLLLISLLTLSCRKDKVSIEEITEPIAFRQPSHFPEAVYPIDQFPITEEGFELGRELFYSTFLSLDNTISCGSCHAQTHLFADHNVALSTGVAGAVGTRNSPAIFNMAWQNRFMWDGGVNHLDVFHLAPLTNPVEMNETIPGILAKLNNSNYWKGRFKTAFGVNTISDYEVFKALSQFVLMLISDNSLYDKVVQGKASFSANQQAGYEIFQAKCASCHTEPMYTNYAFINNGLDATPADSGRYKITQDPNDIGKFKVPSLRNILFTYPYMHDGRFFTIDAVFDHYDHGIVASPTLDPSLAGGIPLSTEERQLLKAFLETLNDYELMGNSRLAEP